MLRPCRLGLSPSQGFTLLELLAVVLIIGVIISFAGLSVGQHSSRTLQDEAQRLHALLRLSAEEAVLQGRELALEFGRGEYHFVALTDQGWQPVSDDRMLVSRELPPNLELELVLEGVPTELGDEETPARILVLSSGEMTPFLLNIGMDDEEPYTLEGDLTGRLELRQGAREGAS